MKITIIFVCISALILGVFYINSGYKSAFEADQQCHYELSLQMLEIESFGCDHDLETRQWLLYQKGKNDNPSEVIERFRY